ncbi:hypothetical protein CONCODRAFT_7307 [Conidiobolus coronatus NRRL 28638]|uniref:Uncharacterized protein n=1 Tax=Conidiobolus coronatus (strain ATCC 28846 / CBS 209.66 / NRRL 28638) TaxID=796925 RepID=A0A137P579_CONC2|nr:hypothetical protein CONCODRAFT_7307 [Conidiobolus coronatus NRRL 28638]|eukprot:KXN70166.1 hypothetical protein CONCODRAFT_7307 [Conidiobolus coronatus NRRL 28638]
MSFQNNIYHYQQCVKCNSDVAKLGTNYCKKCQVKPTKAIAKKQDKHKIYYYKFQDRDTKARMLLNDSKSDIGYSLCIQPSTSNTKDTQSVQSYEFFLLPNWNKFRSLKEFTSCITKSDQST